MPIQRRDAFASARLCSSFHTNLGIGAIPALKKSRHEVDQLHPGQHSNNPPCKGVLSRSPAAGLCEGLVLDGPASGGKGVNGIN